MKKRDKQIQINNMEDLNELPLAGEEDSSILHSDIRVTKEDFIISIADEDGKAYEFEKPEFECELLKIINSKIIGYIVWKDNLYPCSWFTLSGVCEMTIVDKSSNYDTFSDYNKDYNLTPIQKKWYEDEANFPAFMILDGKFPVYCITLDKRIAKNNIEHGFRLATKQERDSLYCE